MNRIYYLAVLVFILLQSCCKQFFTTKRDDEKRTFMPLIPWIETEINGIRNGQMIHPTTNPKTLGKAYSNGCIRVRETTIL